MATYPESRYLDEKIAIIKTELQNEINSIEWQIKQEEGKNQPDHTGLTSCIWLVVFVASIAVSLIILINNGINSFFELLLLILLPCAVYFMYVPTEWIASALDSKVIRQRIAELDVKKQKMIDDAEAATDRRIEALVEEYKNQVKEFGRLYHGNPISTAVARWLGTILIPKIEGASRADYYPHIKVSLAFSVEDNCVITEGERKYNLEDVGFVLDGSDYAPMGFAYAVSMHLKKLIAARFPKDPSGTPCNVTLRNTDAEATCTYDAINGNFV
ncbi:MAG: hypothetical protein IJ041_05690 [Clostridia bacterium]|nr:hypothetical protein [Clostridia bacterium]